MSTGLARRVALIGGMLLVLAACGGDASGTTEPTLPTLTDEAVAEEQTTTTTGAADREDAALEYAACMREHGIDMPDPDTSGGGIAIQAGGDGTDFETMEEATAACDPILDAVFEDFEMTPEMEAERRDKDLLFAQCMRDNGLPDWPDPSSDGATSIEIGPDLDPETVNSAMEICSTEVYGEDFGGGMTMVVEGDKP